MTPDGHASRPSLAACLDSTSLCYPSPKCEPDVRYRALISLLPLISRQMFNLSYCNSYEISRYAATIRTVKFQVITYQLLYIQHV